jgi:hypothetical protein
MGSFPFSSGMEASALCHTSPAARLTAHSKSLLLGLV